VRIPQLVGKFESAHLEFRVPDPACNPYIAFACILAAGIDGIKKKIEPGDPVTEDVSRLSKAERARRGIKPIPKSLFEAVEEFSKDEVFRDALSKGFFDEYINIKLAEWDEYSALVTPWETERMINVH
jgi:glutamine synthetase